MQKKKAEEPKMPKRIRRRDTGATPFEWTKELQDEICKVIAYSNESIKTLVKQNPHWPSDFTIWNRIHENADFSRQYAMAKAKQAQVLVDEMLLTSRSSFDKDSAACNRLIIDTNKWIASKMIPKVYGNQVMIDELKGQNDLMMKEL